MTDRFRSMDIETGSMVDLFLLIGKRVADVLGCTDHDVTIAPDVAFFATSDDGSKRRVYVQRSPEISLQIRISSDVFLEYVASDDKITILSDISDDQRAIDVQALTLTIVQIGTIIGAVLWPLVPSICGGK